MPPIVCAGEPVGHEFTQIPLLRIEGDVQLIQPWAVHTEQFAGHD